MRSLFYVCLIFSIIPLIIASIGDRNPEFLRCVQDCVKNNCNGNPGQNHHLPWNLRILLWNCDSDCKYNCMHFITDKGSIGIVQYYGKWPFVRVFGIQELASVIFSFTNWYFHYRGYRNIIKNHQISRQNILRSYYLLSGIIGINSWFWSMIFHTREFLFTEYMDYFGALLGIFYSAYLVTIRLYLMKSSFRIRFLLGLIFLLAYGYHLYYMIYIKFDYGYNILVGSLVGVYSYLLWLIWYRKNKNSSHSRYILIVVIGMILSTLLELIDFVPFYNLIDAHSLWHLATSPLAYYYYKFLELDAMDHEINVLKRL